MIKNWLNNKNHKYTDGLAIYNRVKKNADKDKFFSQVPDCPPSDIHFIYLVRELQYILRVYGDITDKSIKHIGNPAAKPAEKPAAKPDAKAAITVKPINITNKPHFFEGRIDPNTLPDDIRAVYESNKSLNKEISALHARLDIETNLDSPNAAKQRSETKKELDAKIAKRNNNYQIIDDWYVNKDKPKEQPKADPAQLIKDIKAAEKFLQRNKGSKDPVVIEKFNQRLLFLKNNGITWPPSKKK
jgi:hypothetical protein